MTIRKPVKTLEQIEQEQSVIKEEIADRRTLEKKLEYKRGADGLYVIGYSSGGEVPDTLKGKFTSVRHVTEIIQQHEQRQQ